MDGSDYILEVDPAHPLTPIAESASNTKFEYWQHFGQSATGRRHYDAHSHLHGANTSIGGGLAGLLPFARQVCREALAGAALLAQNFISSIAVIPDRGRGQEDLRLGFGMDQCSGQTAGSWNAAFAKAGLLARGPAPGNVLAGKMDYGIEARHCLRKNGFRGIPWDALFFACTSNGGRPCQTSDPSACAFQGRDQRGSDQTRGAAHKDS